MEKAEGVNAEDDNSMRDGKASGPTRNTWEISGVGEESVEFDLEADFLMT